MATPFEKKEFAKEPGKGTTIGETIVIRGEIKGDEDLTVKGRVEGMINLKKSLFIENSGRIKAGINTNEVNVSGELEGNIMASTKTEIASDGRMIGDIKSPRVVISDGAKFKGNIDMETGKK